MQKNIVIVFDCGATNVRVIAIDNTGLIIASESFPNVPQPDPFFPEYRIWDVIEIWRKMCDLSKRVISRIDSGKILGITITTFGVDGTLFGPDGKMLYPVISWHCERTKKIMKEIGKYIHPEELYRENGVLPFSFNTIYKLIWFNENMPHLLKQSRMFLFMPSIFAFFLTGKMVNDVTMAGTSMMTTLSSRGFSGNIFSKTGLPADLMGDPAEPGSIIGEISSSASAETSIPEGIPVVATGHDTQFAVFGSGAQKNQPVLSSGTWEILMVRAAEFKTGREQLDLNITTELDSRPGLFNIGNQWIASGIIEWARRNFFSELKENVYEEMIAAAEMVPQGCNGVSVIPEFYDDREGKPGGQICGLKMESTRQEIYRAILEALSKKLEEGKRALEDAGDFKTDSIICVGGGSRNNLWNRLRAKTTGVPLKIINQKETTVLGASLFVQSACGNYGTPEEAREAIEYQTEIIYPD